MKIRHSVDSDLNNICNVLVACFFNDPVLRFAFTDTDSERRMAALRHFFYVYVNLARKYGGILLAENYAGVLVYFRPELIGMTDKESHGIDTKLEQGCGMNYASVAALMNGLNYYHPETPLHYYIFAIAVNSPFRGGSVTGDLFREMNTILDKDNFPCYAECTRFSTRTLIRRWGYKDADNPIVIDGFPKLYPVWRDPE